MRKILMDNVRFCIDDPVHEGGYWNSVENKTWQPWIFPIYDWLLDKKHCYIDFGAWVGGTVLYASRKAGHCYAFEPDPVAFNALQNNVGCNPDIKNVTLFDTAIWTETGTISMSSNSGGLGNSDTSILLDNTDTTTEVKAIKFSDFMASTEYLKPFDIKDCNLVKFDIEGAEFFVLEDMLDFFKEVQPSIILSAHHHRIDNPEKHMKKLTSMLSFYKHFYNSANKRDHKNSMTGNALITNEEWK